MVNTDIVVNYTLKRYAEGTLFDITLKYIDTAWKLTGTIGGGCICSDTENVEKVIPEDKVSEFFSNLRKTSIPALISQNCELETGFEELTIRNGVFCTTCVWDENYPNEYASLQKLCNILKNMLV